MLSEPARTLSVGVCRRGPCVVAMEARGIPALLHAFSKCVKVVVSVGNGLLMEVNVFSVLRRAPTTPAQSAPHTATDLDANSFGRFVALKIAPAVAVGVVVAFWQTPK